MRVSPEFNLYYVNRPLPKFPDVTNLQSYFPSLEVLFSSLTNQTSGSPTLATLELATEVHDDSHASVENLVSKSIRTASIWKKKMHIVEPMYVMDGTYVLPIDGSLPSFREAWQKTLHKINNPLNEAYTDAVFACMASRLVETGRSPHWCRFFGTYTGRANEYSYNITDDLEDIQDESWFREGLRRGDFQIMVCDPSNLGASAVYECAPRIPSHKKLRNRSDADSLDSIPELPDLPASEPSDSVIEDMTETDDIAITGTTQIDRPRLRLTRVSGSSGSDKQSSEEDDLEYRVIFKHFPVQITLLERCDGSMDDLMEQEIDDDVSDDMRDTKEQRWTAWMFQIIAGLTVAQQAYEFVHNDLHTNNVMWCGTGETHLYYHVHGSPGGDRYYRVPTYGRIFKIIDFGRATYRPHSASQPHKVWFPDAFEPGADAGGQYNCGEFFNKNEPKVQPNKSFDLCRLAVAVLDTLWDEIPKHCEPVKVLTKEPGRVQNETVSPLWNLMWLWLTDKNGCNILRSPSDEERYPDFDLYCAIARDANNAVPAQQLTLPLFDSAFRCFKKDIPSDATLWHLQALTR